MTETQTFPSRPSAAAGPAGFHLLAKPTGAVCNLDCSYCFFLSKEMLYPGSRFRMADDALEAYIRQLLEAHRTPEVTVNWQGGEPTLTGVDFFRRSVELARKHADGRRIVFTIQTNATLLDDEWACTPATTSSSLLTATAISARRTCSTSLPRNGSNSSG